MPSTSTMMGHVAGVSVVLLLTLFLNHISLVWSLSCERLPLTFSPFTCRHKNPTILRAIVGESGDGSSPSSSSLITKKSETITESNPVKSRLTVSGGREGGGVLEPKIMLTWCNEHECLFSKREQVVGFNSITFTSPATGQVMYSWMDVDEDVDDRNDVGDDLTKPTKDRTILLLIKRDDDELMVDASRVVAELTEDVGVRVLLQPEYAAKLKHHHGVDNSLIDLFEPPNIPGFGSNTDIQSVVDEFSRSFDQIPDDFEEVRSKVPTPDLVVTLGGDGLLMFASHMFNGPVPPILCIAGGSLGFLTPFAKHEMVDAIKGSLGLIESGLDIKDAAAIAWNGKHHSNLVHEEPVSELGFDEAVDVESDAISKKPKFRFGADNNINISMRMRLECSIVNREGVVRARFNVLNEVVIDRGSSPYLASLETFCDDTHLTTVQADGIIFSTPTGSTAYSMAAGGSVVHPVVPAILVTPICPHVLSFRSMVFPDHVVIRCTVPNDARSDACVAFDGRYRRLLHRGDSVEIRMSPYPVPTIDRTDHTADWLGSLKRNFNFNTRVQQKPL